MIVRGFRLAVATLSTGAMLAVQTVAFGQDAQRAAADRGAALAQTIRPSAGLGLAVDGDIVVGPDGSRYHVPLDQFYPDTAAGDPASALGAGTEVLFRDAPGLTGAASSGIATLDADTGPVGQAWSTWRTAIDRAPPPLTYGDVFATSGSVLDSLDAYGQCTVAESLAPFERQITTYEERTCNRRTIEVESCTVDHLLEVTARTHEVAFTIDGLADRIDVDLGAGTATVAAGRIEDVCRIVSGREVDTVVCRPELVRESTTVAIPALDAEAFCGPEANSTIGHLLDNTEEPPGQVMCAPSPGFSMAAPTLDFSCPSPVACDRGDEGCRSTNPRAGCTLTGGFAPPVLEGTPYVCREDDIPGEGGGTTTVCTVQPVTSSFTFLLDIREITTDVWEPTACADAITTAMTGACGANIDIVPGSASPGCIDASTGTICPGAPIWERISPPPFDPAEAEVTRAARSVRLGQASCAIETTTSCWTGIDGTETCTMLSSADPLAEPCAALTADPACTYADTALLYDSGLPGVPRTFEDRFLCARDRTVIDHRLVRQAVCSSTIRGMGEDLVSQPREESASFGEAAAYLSAARMIAMDTVCEDNTDPATCQVFEGTPASCKVAVFGIQNCCESPGGIGLGEYLTLILAVGKADSAVRSLDAANVVRSSYEALVDPALAPFEAAYSAVSETFASSINSVFGTTVIDTTEAATSGLLGAVQQGLMRQAAEWTAQTFGEAAANSLFQVVGQNGAGPAVVNGVVQEGAIELAGLAANIASILNVIGIIYTIYSVAKILIQIVWACEEEELALAVKRDLKSAHYVGPFCSQKALFVCLEKSKGYCTFASPLSRIIQQQARPQLGHGWGSPRGPDCRGLTIEELGHLDWSRIDLSEWEGLILTEGVIPGADALNVEALTGSGHALAGTVEGETGAERQNAIDRVLGQTGAVDFEEARRNADAYLRSQGLSP